MVFCSNCGSKVSGDKNYCSKCGHKMDDDELSVVQKSPPDSPEPEETSSKDLEETIAEMPVQEIRRPPPGAIVKEKIPKSTHCQVCNTKTDDICFFCDYAICKQHSVNMQVFTDKAKFGNVIASCPECSGKRNGQQPTEEEAAEIGFFFTIKPYHEWKIIK